eukprot:800963-Amphidinium_carterae.1
MLLDHSAVDQVASCCHFFTPRWFHASPHWGVALDASRRVPNPSEGAVTKVAQALCNLATLMYLVHSNTTSVKRHTFSPASTGSLDSPQLQRNANVSNLTQVLEEADELYLFGQLFPGQGVEEAEEGQLELGDVKEEPELGEASFEDEVEDVWEGEEEAVQEEDTQICPVDVPAKSRTLSRFVSLRLVYGSARRSDFAAAASSSAQ